MTYLALQNAS